MPEPWESDPALSGGHYLLVALPALHIDVVPANVTALLREWECSIDPSRELQWVARTHLATQVGIWEIRDHFVVPTFNTLALIRAAATDDGVLEAFRAAPDRLVHEKRSPGVELGIYGFALEASHEEPINERARPILLGLAVISAVENSLGFKGLEVYKRLEEEAERREDESSLPEGTHIDDSPLEEPGGNGAPEQRG